ncbi:Biotin carboxylase [Dethiosulfatibacter aminovorans DSM 17477]|uniref:Biotin carboxylase n=1 Tax=Dethiosulfatibacter aminovorans DSM 17477 TaxID=1121476 RepID=A0A1M6E8V9_9FIRM|nr:Biotin carboxylase [Dethiosulfatibacter aminovorans DSM 17477]
MKKVLILGVAPVQMDAILVLKELGFETFACAMAKDGPGADAADHFHIIDILDIEKVMEHIGKYDIDAVYSVGSDLAMPIASKISEKLLLPYFVSSKTATICNNKERMRQALGRSFEGNIPFQVFEDEKIRPDLKMPFIMKPTDSQGQRGIYLVNSIEEYRENFQTVKEHSRSGKVIVEKYVEGPEISVNLYMIDGKLSFMFVSDRETWPQYLGLVNKHVVPSKTMDREKLKVLEKMVLEACHRIGIMNGPAYFQVKMENGRPYIIEVTPRLDGCHMWKLLTYHTGINILKLTFEHLLNGDTGELDKRKEICFGHELEFFCQKPNTIMDRDRFVVPKDGLEYYFYYESGDEIRPVNGKYDKVGYYIKSQNVPGLQKQQAGREYSFR